MELRHLRYFVVLAQELHFTRAAERLNIAPPTLTVQIQEIERRIGAPLLVRSRRSVALTKAGAVFLREAQAVLARFSRAETIGRRAALGQIGRLDVGYVGSAVYSGVLQEAVRRFRGAHPDVDVHTRECAMDALPGRVLAGEIDIGFVRLPMLLAPGLARRVLLRDRFCLAMQQDHPLARQARDPAPGQIAHEPLVVPEQIAGTNEVARQGRFVPHIVARPGPMSAVLTEVSLGTGLSIVPSSVREALRLHNLTFREIAGKPILSEIAAVYREEPDPMSGLFVAELDHQAVGAD